MTYYKQKYRSESPRWQFWNYSLPATYFLTTCIEGRHEILGKVENGKMKLSDEGRIVEKEILKIESYNKRVILDEWVIMPNHIHFLITLGIYEFQNNHSEIDTRSFDESLEIRYEKFIEVIGMRKWGDDELKAYKRIRRQMLIPKLMGKFKNITSGKINELEETYGRRNWQPRYHDHVVRNEKSYWTIKNYIIQNPLKWEKDMFFGNQ